MQLAIASFPELSLVSLVVIEPASAFELASALAALVVEIAVLAMKIFLSSLRLAICAN
jgi:hypothetical protein